MSLGDFFKFYNSDGTRGIFYRDTEKGGKSKTGKSILRVELTFAVAYAAVRTAVFESRELKSL